jgi:hypothetical protein
MPPLIAGAMQRPPLAGVRRQFLPARRDETSIFLLAVGQTLITPITGREYIDVDIDVRERGRSLRRTRPPATQPGPLA